MKPVQNFLPSLGLYRTLDTPTQYLQATLRSLRRRLLPQIATCENVRETKKTAIYRSRGAAFLHLALHLVPVAASIALVVLNCRTTFIGNISTTTLTAIQFASKALEFLCQASIAAIVLAFVRNVALSRDAVPFGALVAPLLVSHLSTLWSLELWGLLTTTNVHKTVRLMLGLIIPIAVSLAALIGPSGAVLMIPRPVNHVTHRRLELFNQSDVVYPRSIELSTVACCGTTLPESRTLRQRDESPHQLVSCVSNDSPFCSTLTSGSVVPNVNVTWRQRYHEFEQDDRVLLPHRWGVRNAQFALSKPIQEQMRTVATVPTVLSLQSIPREPSIVTVRAPQPYVYTDCWRRGGRIDTANQCVDFDPVQAGLGHVLSWGEITDAANDSASNGSVSTLFVTLDNESGGNVSMAWIRPPIGSNTSLLTTLRVTYPFPSNGSFVETCIVDAYWVTVSSNISYDQPFENAFPSGSNSDPHEVISGLEDTVLISISPEWAKRAYQISVDGDEAESDDMTGSNIYLQAIRYALALSEVPGSGEYWPIMMPVSTDGCSKLGYGPSPTEQQCIALRDYMGITKLGQNFDEILVYTGDGSWVDPAMLSRIEVRSYIPGYGYDTSTTTVKLSLAVFMFYLTMTIIYLLYTMIVGSVATSWDSVAELVILALNSQRPDSLRNTSVGIDMLGTFRHPVNIRVNQDNTLELVFESDGLSASYKMVISNRKY